MLGIFSDVFKRATFQDEPRTGPQRDDPRHGDMQQRAPFHWSHETRRRKGWGGDDAE